MPLTLTVNCTGAFTVTLARGNGALTGVYNAAGRRVTPGSRNGYLFGATSPGGGYCGGCGCGNVTMGMSYAWSPGGGGDDDGGALTLTYTPRPTPGPGWAAVVTLTARPSSGAFDLALRVARGPDAGPAYDTLLFPSELLLDAGAGVDDALAALHLPLSPGAALQPAFFAARRPASWSYPDAFSFASWWQADFTANGSVAVYDVSGPDAVVPARSTLALAGGAAAPTAWYLTSALPVNISVGCAPDNSGHAPCAVGVNGTVTKRFVVSVVAADPLAAVRRYAVDNGMLPGGTPWPAPPYASLRSKLAAVSPAFWRQALAAPLMKVDAGGLRVPFGRWRADVLPALPPPVLLHVCGFSPCGSPATPAFDCNYPDMLPPATSLGSACDMQTAFAAAAVAGHLTMPYRCAGLVCGVCGAGWGVLG